MKFFCFILTILSLCIVYKDMNGFRNEKLNILNESDKGLHCEARIVTNILQVNDKSNDIYDCTFIRIRNEFTNRAITMCFDDTLFAIMNYSMYNICNLIIWLK